jgi:uncharacterized ubiquitin-like protein YukD
MNKTTLAIAAIAAVFVGINSSSAGTVTATYHAPSNYNDVIAPYQGMQFQSAILKVQNAAVLESITVKAFDDDGDQFLDKIFETVKILINDKVVAEGKVLQNRYSEDVEIKIESGGVLFRGDTRLTVIGIADGEDNGNFGKSGGIEIVGFNFDKGTEMVSPSPTLSQRVVRTLIDGDDTDFSVRKWYEADAIEVRSGVEADFGGYVFFSYGERGFSINSPTVDVAIKGEGKVTISELRLMNGSGTILARSVKQTYNLRANNLNRFTIPMTGSFNLPSGNSDLYIVGKVAGPRRTQLVFTTRMDTWHTTALSATSQGTVTSRVFAYDGNVVGGPLIIIK